VFGDMSYAVTDKLQLGIGIFNGPPETWAITLVPILLLWGYGLLRREIELLIVLPDFLILILTGALAYSDSSHRFTYYLFSGMVAYLCYRVMVRLER